MMPLSEHQLHARAELMRLLTTATRLRSPVAGIGRVLGRADDPLVTSSQLAGLIAQDPSLAEALLQVAGVGSQGQCASLAEAIDRLGREQVYILALSMAALGPLDRPLSGYRLGEGELWAHSLAVAKAAHWLAQLLAYADPVEAIQGGLLHDMGKLLLDPFVAENYHPIVECLWKRKMHLWQVEEQLLGIDHAGAGGLVAAGWGFPPGLVDAIRYHHTPARAATQPELAAIVSLADSLTPLASLGLSALGGRRVHPEAIAILGLDLPAIEQMRARLWQNQAHRKPSPVEVCPPYIQVSAET